MSAKRDLPLAFPNMSFSPPSSTIECGTSQDGLSDSGYLKVSRNFDSDSDSDYDDCSKPVVLPLVRSIPPGSEMYKGTILSTHDPYPDSVCHETPVHPCINDGEHAYILEAILWRDEHSSVYAAKVEAMSCNTSSDSLLSESFEPRSGMPLHVSVKAYHKAHGASPLNSVANEIEALRRISSSDHSNSENVYIVVDLHHRDLRAVLDDHILSMSDLRILAAQLLLGIEELHSLGIVHRNISIENIYIASKGHLVLGDFSHSALISGKRTEDEIAADIHAYGLFLLDLLRVQRDMDQVLDADARRLLEDLLGLDPGRRLLDIELIKGQPFFMSDPGFDWQHVKDIQLSVAAFQPSISTTDELDDCQYSSSNDQLKK
ncbi:kinase-like protein [Peniophora sp. CONT]|nr:kinase-like protein [Peniophora sp. CONT]